jgi:hypothetical protein
VRRAGAGDLLVDEHLHGAADRGRVDAVELNASFSSGVARTICSVFSLRSTSARVVIISQT